MRKWKGGPVTRLPDAELRRFLTFLLVGGLNAAVGYGIFATLILLGLPTPAAVILGTIIAVLFNFLSTGTLVFRSSTPGLLPRFLAVYAVQMGLNVASMEALERVGLHPLVAGALLLPPLAIFTYLAMRRFVYSNRSAGS
jgi:putative flippase GtrA